MATEGPQVEFDREVTGPLLEDGDKLLGQRPAQRFWQSVRVVRWATMTAGAAVLAYLTHRSGLALDGALCVFLGLLPVLWILSWFAGVAIGARRATSLVKAAVDQANLGDRLARIERHSQHVHLNVANDALEVTLKQGEQSESHRWLWRDVQLIRQGAEAFWLRREADVIEVPLAAFTDAQAFDTFALAAQARIWAAMR